MNSALEMVTAFKSIHVLNDIVAKPKNDNRPRLKATHYACVLVAGRSPVWGVWTVKWKFVMFCGSRQQIADQYPAKSWTTTMASWLLSDAESDYKDIGKRVRALEEKYGGEIKREEVVEPPRPSRSNLPRAASAEH